MINLTQRGCDRCGNMFEPEHMVDLQMTFADGSVVAHQLCVNCNGLLAMMFPFTESRKVMDVQTTAARDRQTKRQADKG